ncbi:MAG: carboxymuconolactone decarboxylase family protein [Phycisphaerales bacterium]|nr:MAG: carboxymuconolactone decarboxylase family protein [Phycisphaerales bacterium]
MDKKIEEMIALGVSYGINCTFCMEYHKTKALQAGLAEEEMRAVLKVAEQVKTGAANKTKAVAKQLFGEPEDSGSCSSDDPCCP